MDNETPISQLLTSLARFKQKKKDLADKIKEYNESITQIEFTLIEHMNQMNVDVLETEEFKLKLKEVTIKPKSEKKVFSQSQTATVLRQYLKDDNMVQPILSSLVNAPVTPDISEDTVKHVLSIKSKAS